MSISLADEADAYLLLERLRWGGPPPECLHCGVAGRCYFLAPANGRSRLTRSGAPTQRRVWKCGSCRRQFSVLTATVLQGTRISLRSWIAAVEDRATNGTDEARPVPGLSSEAARHVARLLDAALLREPARSCLAGLVADGDDRQAVTTVSWRDAPTAGQG